MHQLLDLLAREAGRRLPRPLHGGRRPESTGPWTSRRPKRRGLRAESSECLEIQPSLGLRVCPTHDGQQRDVVVLLPSPTRELQ